MNRTKDNHSFFKRFRFLSSVFVLMMLGASLQAQTNSYTLKGTVTDNVGPVPGVSAQIKNTNTGEIKLANESQVVNKITINSDILGLGEVVITRTGALTAKKQLCT